jgi:hypothetical protein
MAVSIKTSSLASISSGSRYFAGLCGVVLAIAFIIIGLEVSLAIAGSEPKPSINVLRKGDRLPLVTSMYRDHGDQPLHVSVPSSSASDKMAEGCEALVSSQGSCSLPKPHGVRRLACTR